MDKAQEYLCLARKAGFLMLGEERCAETMEDGKGKLLLCAADAPAPALRRAESMREGHRALSMTLPWTRAELSALLGKGGCSLLLFTDLGLAAAFASAMAESREDWQEPAAALISRRDKARRRAAAPRKHKRISPKGGKRNGT